MHLSITLWVSTVTRRENRRPLWSDYFWLAERHNWYVFSGQWCLCLFIKQLLYRLQRRKLEKRPNRRHTTKLWSSSVNKKRIVCSPLHWTAITGQWHTYTFVGARKRWYKGKQSSQRLYWKRPNYSQTSLIRTLKAIESVRTERTGCLY